MKKYHFIKNLRFDKHFMLITVVGKDLKIDLRRYSRKLATADDASRMKFEKGEIWHTSYDYLDYIDTNFPGRVDERLSLFVSALYIICAEYTLFHLDKWSFGLLVFVF